MTSPHNSDNQKSNDTAPAMGTGSQEFGIDCIICKSSEFQVGHFHFLICYNIRNEFTSEATQRLPFGFCSS